MNYPRVGIGVLIFNGNCLLLGKRKTKHGSDMWGPPGGHLEFGESFEQCAIREVLEETGVTISVPRVISITNDIFLKDDKHYVSIFLTAKYPQEQQVMNREPDKITAWEWVSIDKLPEELFLPLQNLILEKGEGFLLTLSQQIRQTTITHQAKDLMI